MREAKFDMAYISRYSPRSGTVAAKLQDDVSSVEKARREKILNDILITTSLENNKGYLNKTVDVLVDGWKNGFCYGKTATSKIVAFSGDKSWQGSKLRVKITEAGSWSLKGEII
jgi:tRNA-2-methylthio-N6-dimethylallyladenosine synthase